MSRSIQLFDPTTGAYTRDGTETFNRFYKQIGELFIELIQNTPGTPLNKIEVVSLLGNKTFFDVDANDVHARVVWCHALSVFAHDRGILR